MSRERDLLPWIFGGLSAAALAVAVAAVSAHKPLARTAAPMTAQATSPAAAPTVAASPAAVSQLQTPAVPQSATVAQAAALPAVAPMPATPDAPAAPDTQPGQIWECTTNGIKTFSNNPCGEHSSLREVGPINSMNAPAPPSRYARAYPEPARYAAPYADPNAAYDNEQAYSDQDGAESAGNSYTIVQGVAFLPRRHPEHHPHRPTYAHRPVAAPRRF